MDNVHMVLSMTVVIGTLQDVLNSHRVEARNGGQVYTEEPELVLALDEAQWVLNELNDA